MELAEELSAEAQVTATNEALLDIGAISDYLGESRNHVDELSRKHGLPFVKLGQLKRYELKAVQKWIRDRMVGDKHV